MPVRRGSNLLAKKEIATTVATIVMFVVTQTRSQGSFDFLSLPHIILALLMLPAAIFVIRVTKDKHTCQFLLPFLIIGPLLLVGLALAIVADSLAISAAGAVCTSFNNCTPVIHILGSIVSIVVGIWGLVVVGQFYHFLKSAKIVK